jgi:hypothetical protein
MRIRITINNSLVYDGDADEMPCYGDYVDIYEEAMNRGITSGKSANGWEWEVA